MAKLSGKEFPAQNCDGVAADHDAIAFDSDADEPPASKPTIKAHRPRRVGLRPAIREMAGSARAPGATNRNFLRGSFIETSLRN